MTDKTYHITLCLFLGVFVLAQGLFAAVPWLDLAVSSLLLGGVDHFPAEGSWPYRISAILRASMELLAFLIVIGTLIGFLWGRLRGDLLRCWAFFAANLVLGPGILVNLVLKAHFGRARPVNIVEFGGNAHFTPAWQLTDQCSKNCSFTSGEVSVATTLALCALLICWDRMSVRGRWISVAAAAAFIWIVSFFRLDLGRHFLSDAVFSVLISLGVALALYPLLDLGRARKTCVPIEWSRLVRFGLSFVDWGRAHTEKLLNRWA